MKDARSAFAVMFFLAAIRRFTIQANECKNKKGATERTVRCSVFKSLDRIYSAVANGLDLRLARISAPLVILNNFVDRRIELWRLKCG
jgi:hypothetical protein